MFASSRIGYTSGERLALAVLFCIVGAGAVVPMLRLAQEALFPGGAFNPAAALAALDRPAVWRAVGNSLVTAFAGAAGAILLGGGFALLVALTDLRSRGLLVLAFMLPLAIAPQVTALAWIELFGANSALLKPLGLAPAQGTPHPIYGPGGVILLFALEQAPIVFLAVRAALRAVPAALVEAAQTLGASPWQSTRLVVAPLALPGLAAGGALAFAANLGNFGIPAFVAIPAGYPMLITLIYQRLSGFGPGVLGEVAGLSLLLAILAFAGLALHDRLAVRADTRASEAGPALRPWSLGRARLPVELVCWTFIILVVLVPVVALLAGALVPAVGVPLAWDTLTFGNFAFVLFEHDATRRAFANSAWLSTAAALLLLVLAIPLAYFTSMRGGKVAAALGRLAELPYALPGIVLAIALIICLIRPLPVLNIGLYNTVWIILLAYLIRFFALALRPVAAAFAQVDPAVDEVARLMGASLPRRLVSVFLPGLAPAAAAGAIVVFLTAFNELTVSALLWSSGVETVGVVLFGLEQGGDPVSANAVATLSVALSIALMLAARLVARRLPPGVLPWSD